MATTTGWNVWGRTGDKMRQFTVAVAEENAALATVTAKHPDVSVISRHIMDAGILSFLHMADGQVCEWIELESSRKGGGPPIVGGVPIDKSMK